MPAHAQATGLLLKKYQEGITLHSTNNGLRLNFKQLELNSLETPSNHSSSSASIFRNELRANWPLSSSGLQTSLGLSWSGDGFSSARGLSHGIAAKTFFGLDWYPGQKKHPRWSLSAEMGTALSNSGACNATLSYCTPSGLNPQFSGSGLRLNPYLNFGATYRFGR